MIESGTLCQMKVEVEASLASALVRISDEGFNIALVSAACFSASPREILRELLANDPRLLVIIHDPDATLDDAIRLTREGAFYSLTGKLDPEGLASAVDQAVEKLRPKLLRDAGVSAWRRFVVGQSRAVSQICDVIQLVASKRCTVLITGETGTGKEVIAKAIHAASPRSALSMVPVNCTALPASLVETELFGHAKGAFTGAHSSRIGRFEQANRSTIFLDEIGDLPLEAQAKLLRVLQEQEFQRVGSSETVRVDVRVVAASNVNLEEAVRERRFREDLYYRLNVVPIQMPPLRERREDIPLLIDHFLEKIRGVESGATKQISVEAIDFLMNLDWPGNVRQLEHTVQMALALSGDRQTLYPNDFLIPQARPERAPANRTLVTVSREGLDFDEAVTSFERSLLNQALALSGGNKARAADLLKIKRTTLLAKLKTMDERTSEQSAVELDVCGATPGPRRALTALVVEDDAAVQKLITKTLEKEGYRILEARTASAAQELFECWKTHITLLVIPGELSRLSPDLPAIIISDYRDTKHVNRRSGCTGVLSRPFSAEELVAVVKGLTFRAASEVSTACA